MIIVREVFEAKPGMASKLAKLFKKAFANDPKARIMTDMVGPYNTVIVERPMDNLDAFSKEMEAYKSGEAEPKMAPETAKEMSKYTEMYATGRREIFQVWE